jgi:hypothetical protein
MEVLTEWWMCHNSVAMRFVKLSKKLEFVLFSQKLPLKIVYLLESQSMSLAVSQDNNKPPLRQEQQLGQDLAPAVHLIQVLPQQDLLR